MIHPKMKYTYIGVDSHKDTHTAVALNCFYEKLGEITFANAPAKFENFLEEVGSGTNKQDMVDSESQSVFKKRSLSWSPSPLTALTVRAKL
jgi:hypothetical protein